MYCCNVSDGNSKVYKSDLPAQKGGAMISFKRNGASLLRSRCADFTEYTQMINRLQSKLEVHMKKIEKDEFLVTYDEEIGVVYTPRKGVVRTTTPEHANKIKRFLLQYEQGKMSKEEMQRFEKYMRGSLAEYDDLPVDECLSLDERDILRRMEIIVTNECNLRCKYCYAHGGSYDMKVQKMSPYIACEYLEKLLLGKYRYVEYITFFGGEPTLCPDTILAICEFFENNVQKHNFEKMPKFSMISNGTLIDENMAEIIKKYDIGMTISIDGPEEINNLLRVDTFGKGSFERISRGIELLVKKDVPPLLLEATYTSKHKDLGYSKENIREYLKENFFRLQSIAV